MKTNRITLLVTAALGLVVLSTSACNGKDTVAEQPVSPAKEGVATTTASPARPGSITTVQLAPTAIPSVASVRWSDIKDHTYDMRAQFFVGLKRMEARVDEQLNELTARRAAMKSTANTKDWDFAMKEMENARSYLKAVGDELGEATPEIWDQQKDKVGQAWVRTQEAYSKVKSSTTN